jgi:hypothetical protein
MIHYVRSNSLGCKPNNNKLGPCCFVMIIGRASGIKEVRPLFHSEILITRKLSSSAHAGYTSHFVVVVVLFFNVECSLFGVMPIRVHT